MSAEATDGLKTVASMTTAIRIRTTLRRDLFWRRRRRELSGLAKNSPLLVTGNLPPIRAPFPAAMS
jgi:hypothetical protein